MLKKIGYDVDPAKNSYKKYNLLIKSYQMHYVNRAKLAKFDKTTYETLKSHFNQLLTHKQI